MIRIRLGRDCNTKMMNNIVHFDSPVFDIYIKCRNLCSNIHIHTYFRILIIILVFQSPVCKKIKKLAPRRSVIANLSFFSIYILMFVLIRSIGVSFKLVLRNPVSITATYRSKQGEIAETTAFARIQSRSILLRSTGSCENCIRCRINLSRLHNIVKGIRCLWIS